MGRLGDLMSWKVHSVSPAQSVAEVAQYMVESRVGSAVVVDGPWLLGIFTERDALRAAGSGTDLTSAKVRDWMTQDPITVTPDTDVEEASALMATNGFRHLPVVDGDTVVGMVSLRDLLSTRIRKPAPPG